MYKERTNDWTESVLHGDNKSQIIIDEPIKALGIYHAKIKVAQDISSNVKLYVIKG